MRKTLYLLPGLLCDASVFAAQRAALAGDYDVRVPDFFGLDSIQSMAEHVLSMAPQTFSVCGFSMGGRVALQMMRVAPQRIARLCLLDTGPTAASAAEPAARQPLLDLASTQGMAAVAKAWLPPMLHPARRNDAALVGPLTEMVLRASPQVFAKQVRALLTRPDAMPLLEHFRLPVYVVVGRQDEWSTLAQHEDFARLIPGAKLIVIENSGHFTPVEQPQTLTQILRDFMREPV